jgi:hypothetical protein
VPCRPDVTVWSIVVGSNDRVPRRALPCIPIPNRLYVALHDKPVWILMSGALIPTLPKISNVHGSSPQLKVNSVQHIDNLGRAAFLPSETYANNMIGIKTEFANNRYRLFAIY